MIGVLINEKAITEDNVLVEARQLPEDIYWLSEHPSAKHIGQVASWGVLADLFGLSNDLSIVKSKTALKKMNALIPKEWCDKGTSISRQLYSMLNMRDKLVSSFPQEIENNFLDKMRLFQAKGTGASVVKPNHQLNLSQLTLPEMVDNTKLIPHPTLGHEGVYETTIQKCPKGLEAFEGITAWMTCLQVKALEKSGFTTTAERAIKFISQNEFVPIKEHSLIKPIVDSMKECSVKEQWILDRIIIDFLSNIPRSQGIHPVSILIKGQLWANTLKEVISLRDNGVFVTSFSHDKIWVNIDE